MTLYVVLIGWDEDTRTLRLFTTEQSAEKFAKEVRARRPVYVDVKAVDVPVILKESADGRRV